MENSGEAAVPIGSFRSLRIKSSLLNKPLPISETIVSEMNWDPTILHGVRPYRTGLKRILSGGPKCLNKINNYR